MNAQKLAWQLKRVTLRYSETGGSSLGVRFYLRHLLPTWKKRNPQVDVVTEHSQMEHPWLLSEWRSKEKYEITLKNLKPRQIEDLLNLARNSESPNLYLKHGGPRVWTERRSVQGLWQPSVEGMFQAMRFARLKDWHKGHDMSLRYSRTSVKLARQHLLEGRGRWGDQTEHPKGFDRHVLEQILNQPFLPGSEGAAEVNATLGEDEKLW